MSCSLLLVVVIGGGVVATITNTVYFAEVILSVAIGKCSFSKRQVVYNIKYSIIVIVSEVIRNSYRK